MDLLRRVRSRFGSARDAAHDGVPREQQSRPGQLIPRALFDEALYLQRNPDVAAAIVDSAATAYDHYVKIGYADEATGRRPRNFPTQSQRLTTRFHADEDLIDRLIDLEIEKRTLLEAWDQRLANVGDIDFHMLSEDVEDAVAPPLDRMSCDETELDEDQLAWRRGGYLIKPGFIPNDLIDAYCAVRKRHPSPGGWSCPTPYMHVPEVRGISLYPPLMKLMERLVGEEMGLNLNLTGWVSTERNWHQDDYLNPPFVNSWYAAVWVALEDIHPDSGPFEYVPGSHKWPVMRGHKVRMFLRPDERDHPNWPGLAERFVDRACEKKIDESGLSPRKFIARKGDLLIWHGRLMHRGTTPNVAGMPRRTLISHYSGLSHRIDMPVIARTPEGSAYFHLERPLDFDPSADLQTVP